MTHSDASLLTKRGVRVLIAGMTIAVTAMGSEGDVRPFVALAKALRSRGHDAFLVAAERFRARAERAEVPFRATGQTWDEARYRAVMASVLAESSPMKQIRAFVDAGANELVDSAVGVLEATRGARLIVQHAGDVNAFAASIVHGTPRVTGTLAPGLLPGGFLPWMTRTMTPFLTDAPFQKVLAAAGVPPRKKIVIETAESPLLNLVAISPHVVPPHAAWRGRFEATGYWFLDEPSFEPSRELRAFVDAGEAPIVIGFGSMMDLDARARTKIDAIVEAVVASGRRAVIQAPDDVRASRESDAVFFTGYAPHDWLFARSAGVVHHGGAGTCAAAIRAGVPSAIVFVFGDQPDWGKRLAALGVGTEPLAMKDLDAASLRERLMALDSPKRTKARELGTKVRSEDGLARACERIEAVLPRA